MVDDKRTLREWRAYRMLSKQDLAGAIGVHASTYAKWEANPEEIRMRDAARIAEILGCSVRDINFFEANSKFNLGNIPDQQVGQTEPHILG